MLVKIMLEQRVVGVVGLEAADSRIRIPSSKAPGAWLGHEPGDTKGQQRSQADSRDLAMTSVNALEQQRSRRHAVWHARGQGFKSPQLHQAQRIGSTPARAVCPQIVSRSLLVIAGTL